MDNEYTRKEVECPLSGTYCDRKDKNCNICLAEEEEWERKVTANSQYKENSLKIKLRIKVEDTRLCGTSNILNVYILSRQDDWKYDEPIEQTIVAKTKERAIELANKYPGIWDIEKEIDLTTERVLTIDKNEG